jgi:hypothetical protein
MTDNPESALNAYIRAFETLDAEAVLPFYHIPGMFITPQDVFAMPDANTARALLFQFLGQLRAQSYRCTEISGLKVCSLSPGLVFCTGVFVRFNTSGQEIARVGFTYSMRNIGGSRKFVVAIVHEPLATSHLEINLFKTAGLFKT